MVINSDVKCEYNINSSVSPITITLNHFPLFDLRLVMSINLTWCTLNTYNNNQINLKIMHPI